MIMRIARWLAASVAFGLALGAAAAERGDERVLGNGLKVVVKTDRRAPVVASQLWYRAGSMDESYGITGVAHVLEHMMFKGTRELPAGEFSRRIAAAGGRENAFTSRDYTAYFQTLQKDRLELAFRLEADRMVNLVLAPEEFAKEIQVVMEERRLRTEDRPRARLFELLLATAFLAHPYRHPVIGWMDDLRQMRVEDAARWYRDWYAPNNAVLVVVGDIDPETVFALAERYFGPIPARALPERKPQNEPPQMGMRRVVLKAPAKLPLLAMAWQAPRLQDPLSDRLPYALEVLAGVLDGHDSARLPRALIRERGLAVSVNAGYDPIGRGPALFYVTAEPAEGVSVAELEAAIEAELARIVEDGVDARELERVKAQVLAGQVFQQDSLFYQGMQIGQWEMAGLPWRARATRFKRLAEVSAEEVRAAAREILVQDRLTVAVLDPQPMPAERTALPRFGGRHVD